tara:strand:+ start:269 stop:496 length:228 start_codon:yes stop_codon:yes gene_type:complete
MDKIAINHIPSWSTLNSGAKSKGTIRNKDQALAKNDPGDSHVPVIFRAIKADASIVITGNIIINQFFDFVMTIIE